MPNRRDRDFRNLPIREKESYKWIEVANNSKHVLCKADMVTIIQDREADIYEVFTVIPDKRHHLLVRSSFDRALQEGLTLSGKLATIPVSGFHTIKLNV